MHKFTKGELSQALKRCSEKLEDYIELYNKEYKRSNQLQDRVDKLKRAQRNAQMEYKGIVE